MLEPPAMHRPRVLSHLQFRRRRSRAMRQRRALYRRSLVRARAAIGARPVMESPGGVGARPRRATTAWSRWTWVRPTSIRARCRWRPTARSPSYSLTSTARRRDRRGLDGQSARGAARPDVKTAPVARFGPSIERHPRFPKRTNVGFMQIVDRGHIALRVFERGVGETLACGTGACAAVAVGRRGLLDADVRVDLPGGTAHWFPGRGGRALVADRAGDDGV
jgi:hypothetical protein